MQTYWGSNLLFSGIATNCKLFKYQWIFMILFLQMCELCEQQTVGMMTDSNKSGDDLLEFPGSNQTIKLTISNQELF